MAGRNGDDSHASKTYPTQCSTLRKGGHVMLKKHPCKIVELLTSSPGKHGHSKIHIIGLDVLSGRKYEDIYPSSHKVQVPLVSRVEYQLIDIQSDGFLSLMDDNGAIREDLQLPEGDFGKEIHRRFEDGMETVIVVLQAIEGEIITGVKKHVAAGRGGAKIASV